MRHTGHARLTCTRTTAEFHDKIHVPLGLVRCLQVHDMRRRANPLQNVHFRAVVALVVSASCTLATAGAHATQTLTEPHPSPLPCP